MELRATEDRTHEMEAEVEHWREPAARPEQWLRTIQNEIEEKLLPRRLFSDAEESHGLVAEIPYSDIKDDWEPVYLWPCFST